MRVTFILFCGWMLNMLRVGLPSRITLCCALIYAQYKRILTERSPSPGIIANIKAQYSKTPRSDACIWTRHTFETLASASAEYVQYPLLVPQRHMYSNYMYILYKSYCVVMRFARVSAIVIALGWTWLSHFIRMCKNDDVDEIPNS